MTDKKKWSIAFIVIAIIVLWLLWRNRSAIAPEIFNAPPSNYLDVNYPSMGMPQSTPRATSGSCGCNPAASKYLEGSANAFNQAQDAIDKQLKEYTDSMNQYFSTKIIQ